MSDLLMFSAVHVQFLFKHIMPLAIHLINQLIKLIFILPNKVYKERKKKYTTERKWRGSLKYKPQGL